LRVWMESVPVLRQILRLGLSGIRVWGREYVWIGIWMGLGSALGIGDGPRGCAGGGGWRDAGVARGCGGGHRGTGADGMTGWRATRSVARLVGELLNCRRASGLLYRFAFRVWRGCIPMKR